MRELTTLPVPNRNGALIDPVKSMKFLVNRYNRRDSEKGIIPYCRKSGDMWVVDPDTDNSCPYHQFLPMHKMNSSNAGIGEAGQKLHAPRVAMRLNYPRQRRHCGWTYSRSRWDIDVFLPHVDIATCRTNNERRLWGAYSNRPRLWTCGGSTGKTLISRVPTPRLPCVRVYCGGTEEHTPDFASKYHQA